MNSEHVDDSLCLFSVSLGEAQHEAVSLPVKHLVRHHLSHVQSLKGG